MQLNDLICILKGHRVFIQTHNFPDQDAIASAFGLQYLLEKFGIKSTICHHGEVERAVTASMVSELGIEMSTDDELGSEMSEDGYIVIVDAQKGNGNTKDLSGEEVACIDHHPIDGRNEKYIKEYKYKDLRIVGSCATIIAEYYRDNSIEMPENVATALLYGLKCDTRDFTRGVTALDIDIFGYLFPKANTRIIRRFQSASTQLNELKDFANSLSKIDIYGGISFTYLNMNRCAEGFLAYVADFILDIDEVHFAVVYTIRTDSKGKDIFKFSVRSEFEELDAGLIINKALKGIGGGGGHSTMAGGSADKQKTLRMAEKEGKDVQTLIRDLFIRAVDDISHAGINANAASAANKEYK